MAKKYPDPSSTLAYGNVSSDLRNQKSSSYIPKPDWQKSNLDFVNTVQGYKNINVTSDYKPDPNRVYGVDPYGSYGGTQQPTIWNTQPYMYATPRNVINGKAVSLSAVAKAGESSEEALNRSFLEQTRIENKQAKTSPQPSGPFFYGDARDLLPSQEDMIRKRDAENEKKRLEGLSKPEGKFFELPEAYKNPSTAMPRSGKDAGGNPETTGYGKDYLELPKGYKPEGPAGFYSNSPTWSGGTLNTNNTPPQQLPPPSTTNLSSTMPAPSPYRSALAASPTAYTPMQSSPLPRSASESKFSEGFLNYLDQARAMKLRQGEMDIEKTGAETGLLGIQTGRLQMMTPYEIAQIAAQTGLTGAQTNRINTLTPYEAAQMGAQTGLYGAQALLAGAQAQRTTTLTPYEAAQMRAETQLTGSQSNRINTLTPYEAAQMGAQTSRINTLTPYEAAEIGSRMNLTNAQTARLAAMTPYEIQQIIAGNQLTGAQAENLKAKTLSEYGMTPTGIANIFATTAGGQASLINANANMLQATPKGPYFSPVGYYPYSSGLYTTTQTLPPPPPRKDINVGLGGRTYTGNFGSYSGYPVTGNYNQRGGRNK